LCAFAAGLALLDIVDCQEWSSRDNGDVCVNDSVVFLYVCVCERERESARARVHVRDGARETEVMMISVLLLPFGER